MDVKLTIVFLFLSAIIALSYLDDDNISRMRHQLLQWRRRNFRLRRHKS